MKGLCKVCGRKILLVSTHCRAHANLNRDGDKLANAMPTEDEIKAAAAIERSKWSKRKMRRQEGRTRATIARVYSVADDGMPVRKSTGAV